MLTQAQKQKYLTEGGIHCPYCDSENISTTYVDPETVQRFTKCSDCGKEWAEIYKLIDIEEIKWTEA